MTKKIIEQQLNGTDSMTVLAVLKNLKDSNNELMSTAMKILEQTNNNIAKFSDKMEEFFKENIKFQSDVSKELQVQFKMITELKGEDGNINRRIDEMEFDLTEKIDSMGIDCNVKEFLNDLYKKYKSKEMSKKEFKEAVKKIGTENLKQVLDFKFIVKHIPLVLLYGGIFLLYFKKIGALITEFFK